MTRLFEDSEISLGPGAVLLRGFAPDDLPEGVEQVIASAPLRHMTTPGGFRMSVAMTNCGALGWVSDRKGYRYSSVDPESRLAWPSDCCTRRHGSPPPFSRRAPDDAPRLSFTV